MSQTTQNKTPMDCLLFVSKQTGVDVDNIAGSSIYLKFVKARYIYGVLARECTNATLKDIGALINKSYSAIIYYNRQMQYWPEVNDKYLEIKTKFKGYAKTTKINEADIKSSASQ